MRDLEDLGIEVATRAARRSGPALLLGLSGIDGAGKGYLAARLADRLAAGGLRAAAVNVDGWLNLPSIRFSAECPGEHFYHHALRLGAMFDQLVLPLRRRRSHRLVARHVDETANDYRDHRYEFTDVDVVLLEGIFIYKQAFRPHFDLAVWVDCTFETALERALRRAQEGLPPPATAAAYRTIYFPAQRIHLERDRPRGCADVVIGNDPRLGQ